MLAIFPPSPALSACDSLADIDDLDALLDAQGPLSRFGTPPLQVKPIDSADPAYSHPVQQHIPSRRRCSLPSSVFSASTSSLSAVSEDAIELSQNDDLYHLEYVREAAHFTSALNGPFASSSGHTDIIAEILFLAGLEPEIVALAYNILNAYANVRPHPHHTSSCPRANILPGCMWDQASCPSDVVLLTVAALTLADGYIHDHAIAMSYWAHRVCQGAIPTRTIHSARSCILDALDWRLHEFASSDALETSTIKLRDTSSAPQPISNTKISPPLKISIEGAAMWDHGQLTPQATPPASASESPPQQFLPLL